MTRSSAPSFLKKEKCKNRFPHFRRINAVGFTVSLLITALVFSNAIDPAFGQTIDFAGGGHLAGSIKKSAVPDGSSTEIVLPDGGLLVVSPEIIKNPSVQSDAEREYFSVIPFKPDSVKSHLESATWCKERGLTGPASKHYARILELDPENEATHRLLGHVKENGIWMSAKDRLESRGLVRFGGQVMSLQQKELEEKRSEVKKTVLALKKDIRKFYSGIKNGNSEAEEALKKIQDPYALAILTDLLQNEESPEIRRLLAQVMGGIGTPAALIDLGTIALQDVNADVRLTALEQIKKKTIAVPGAIEYFKRGLLSPNNEMVNRAGEALGFLDATSAIPNLINALLTSHQFTVTTGSNQTGASFTNGRLSGFSPGNNARQKVITKTFNNEKVLNALRKVVEIAYPMNPVDFQYDILRWRTWYQSHQKTELFQPRRSD